MNPSNIPTIILQIPYPILAESIPRTVTSKIIELKSIMEVSSLKNIALEFKNNLTGTLKTNVTQYQHAQTQPSPWTQPSS